LEREDFGVEGGEGGGFGDVSLAKREEEEEEGGGGGGGIGTLLQPR